jgi:hypothetical protein
VFDTDAQLRGSALHNARLTEEIVRECRERYDPESGVTCVSLSEEFHVHKTTMQLAINGKTWKWVK